MLHCEEGEEWKAAEILRQQYRCSGEDEIFLITLEKMKRYEGHWHCQQETLFRGCVFAKSHSRRRLEEAAKDTGMFRSFHAGEYSFPILNAEKNFLMDVGGETHCIAMSKGYIQNGKTFVTEGPLCGKEGKIRKIDRHKRIARINSSLDCYQESGLWIGLEIFAKN